MAAGRWSITPGTAFLRHGLRHIEIGHRFAPCEMRRFDQRGREAFAAVLAAPGAFRPVSVDDDKRSALQERKTSTCLTLPSPP